MQDSNKLWFLNSHVTIQLSYTDNDDGISVILLNMAKDDAPPLHVHHVEDEIFHITEGTVRFLIGDRTVIGLPGQTVLAPRAVPHGFRVTSDTARMLVITKGGFERLVRAGGRPALGDFPPELTEPTPAMREELARYCAAQQIDILGPPID